MTCTPTIGELAVQVKRLDETIDLPRYAYPADAGLDLQATRAVTLAPGGGRATIATGIAIALPPGHVGYVMPRSGLAARCGVTVLNAPGTVDAGYRGEVAVTLVNTDPVQPASIRHGDRIAQLVIQEVAKVKFVEVSDLPDTERGAGGHGSSGGFAGNTNRGQDAPEGAQT